MWPKIRKGFNLLFMCSRALWTFLPWLKQIFLVSCLASELGCSWIAYHSPKLKLWLQVGPESYCMHHNLRAISHELFSHHVDNRAWLQATFPSTYQQSKLTKKKNPTAWAIIQRHPTVNVFFDTGGSLLKQTPTQHVEQMQSIFKGLERRERLKGIHLFWVCVSMCVCVFVCFS